MEDWITGVIPWSVHDLADVMAFELKLLEKPKDDWNIDAGKHAIDFGKQCIPADGFHLGHQMVGYLVARYNGNTELARAHAFRYALVREFVSAHMARLRRKGLVHGEGRNFSTCEALLTALCQCPFSEVCTRRGEPSRRFRFTEVMRVASEFKPEGSR